MPDWNRRRRRRLNCAPTLPCLPTKHGSGRSAGKRANWRWTNTSRQRGSALLATSTISWRPWTRSGRRSGRHSLTFDWTPQFEADLARISDREFQLFRKVAKEDFSPACDRHVANPGTAWPKQLRIHCDAHRRITDVYNNPYNASVRQEKHHNAGCSRYALEKARQETWCVAERSDRPSGCRRTRDRVGERRPTPPLFGVHRGSFGLIRHSRYNGLRRWPSSLTAACSLQQSTEGTGIMLGQHVTL